MFEMNQNQFISVNLIFDEHFCFAEQLQNLKMFELLLFLLLLFFIALSYLERKIVVIYITKEK